MLVKSVQVTTAGAGFSSVATGRAETARRPEFTVRLDVGGPVTPSETPGDTWLAALLLPAMFAGESLEVRAPVSAPLLEGVRQIQEILHAWYPDLLRKIEVRAPAAVKSTRPPGVGPSALFFSGGVDSWYSLHKHRGRVRALITGKGFDIPCREQAVWSDLLRSNREIASELGLDLITVETDLRDHLDPVYGHFSKPCLMDFWGQCMHGSCLAAAGLALENFARFIIASSWPYIRLMPWGTHPLLDRLWSNGRAEFVHDGCEEGRAGKLRVVSKLDLALRHLRVCAAAVPGRYNCGECEKCLRTMLTLRLYGALDRARTFDRPLDLKVMESLLVRTSMFPMYRDIAQEAMAAGDAATERLARVLLGERFSVRQSWARLRRFIRRTPLPA